ncbi:hypothetical protein [Streptomyces sp. SAJ15]|uniref:DUF7144 family membrane protein n=1 Tax=Streptomyces sp. SAJ15 TaxID=2011095 RepID=UPI001642A324|nr:hypothetical protein [Streptomyces sp. SAJ15]
MSQQTQHARAGSDTVHGGVIFAAVLMIVAGVLAILQGIGAIAEDDVYARIGDYVFEFDLTGWGWLHLILGVLVLLTGFALLSGQGWSFIAGIIFAGLSIIANFMWLPYTPVWSIILIAIAIFVIWALCVYRPVNRR